MRVDLHAATDVAQYVLFDPAAVPEWIRHDLPFPSGPDWLEDPATRGNLLDYRAECDGDLRARLYVDETPEPRLMELAAPTLSGAVLNVPSGKLWFIGAECLKPDSEEHSTPEAYIPSVRAHQTQAEIPAGRYLVDASEMDPEVIDQRREAEIDPQTRKLLGRQDALMILGCLGVLITLGAIIGFLSAALFGEYLGWLGRWSGIGFVAIVVYLTWVKWLLGRPHHEAARHHRERVLRSWPPLLLHFQTIAESDPAPSPTPGIFGPRPPGESRSDG